MPGNYRTMIVAVDEIFAAMRLGDLTPDEGYAAWQSERANELCARCSYERLGGCGDGRGFPACQLPDVTQRWSHQNRAEVAERGHRASQARDFEQRAELAALRVELQDARDRIRPSREGVEHDPRDKTCPAANFYRNVRDAWVIRYTSATSTRAEAEASTDAIETLYAYFLSHGLIERDSDALTTTGSAGLPEPDLAAALQDAREALRQIEHELDMSTFATTAHPGILKALRIVRAVLVEGAPSEDDISILPRPDWRCSVRELRHRCAVSLPHRRRAGRVGRRGFVVPGKDASGMFTLGTPTYADALIILRTAIYKLEHPGEHGSVAHNQEWARMVREAYEVAEATWPKDT